MDLWRALITILLTAMAVDVVQIHEHLSGAFSHTEPGMMRIVAILIASLGALIASIWDTRRR